MVNEEEPNFMALNRYRNVNKKEIEDAKRFVLSNTKDKSKVASWVKRYADHLTVKDGKLDIVTFVTETVLRDVFLRAD